LCYFFVKFLATRNFHGGNFDYSATVPELFDYKTPPVITKASLDIHTNLQFHTHVKRTNIVLDEKVVATARRLTGLATQREIVDHALRELVRRLEITKLQELEGNIDWDGDLSAMRADRELCEL